MGRIPASLAEMANHRKSVAQILAESNTDKLSKAQLAARLREEQSEPVIHAGRPRMPKNFSELERDAWKSASRIMKAQGTLSKGDGELLELFARTKARWILACKDVAERGFEIKEIRHAKNGDPYEVSIPNPSLKICDACESRLLAYSKALGLTTLDRTKPKRAKRSKTSEKGFVPTPGTAGELSQYFDKGGKLKVIRGTDTGE